jgi:hypothetical protein
LRARGHAYLSPLYTPSRLSSFIVPYPDAATLPLPLRGPLEVYSLFSYVEDPSKRASGRTVVWDVPSPNLWSEPLFVFVDPAFDAYQRARVPDPAAFYGASVESCRQRAANCAKAFVVAALIKRLNRRAFPDKLVSDGANAQDEALAALLAARLEEYEKSRAAHPTLWSFFPRLLSAFPERAGRKPDPAPPVPPARPRGVEELLAGAAGKP